MFLIFDILASIAEEAIEDVEGPSETAADPEEIAKEQESAGEKDQSKWTGVYMAALESYSASPLEE